MRRKKRLNQSTFPAAGHGPEFQSRVRLSSSGYQPENNHVSDTQAETNYGLEIKSLAYIFKKDNRHTLTTTRQGKTDQKYIQTMTFFREVCLTHHVSEFPSWDTSMKHIAFPSVTSYKFEIHRVSCSHWTRYRTTGAEPEHRHASPVVFCRAG